MPRFRRLGLVYSPDGSATWARQAAMLPTPVLVDSEKLRVYFASTDEKNIGRVGYVDLDARDPLKVLTVGREPVLDIGQPGTFDDNGINPCSIVRVGDRLRLYYFGYQLQHHVPYTLFSGVAESTDSGNSFERVSEVPILDRCDGELFLRSAPFVLPHGNGFRMVYVGGSSWGFFGGRTKPVYGLYVIDSADGLKFSGPGRPVISPRLPEEIGFGRPFMVRSDRGSELFYSVRSPGGYTLGYATTRDELRWDRHDNELCLEGPTQPWEQEMTCYSSVIEVNGRFFMFYNGNGYGRTGFGLAMMESS